MYLYRSTMACRCSVLGTYSTVLITKVNYRRTIWVGAANYLTVIGLGSSTALHNSPFFGSWCTAKSA